MVEKQRKRKRAEPEEAEGDAIARSLAAYGAWAAAGAGHACRRPHLPAREQEALIRPAGERFMQMFEDSAAQPSRGAGSQQRGGADSGGGGGSGLSEGSDSDAGSSDLSSASSGGSGSEDEGDARGAEEFVFAANAVAPRSAGRQQQPRAARGPGLHGARPPTPSASPALDASLERKAFMSSKAARVHGGGGAAAAGGGRPGRPTAAAQEAEGVSREEFLKMQREVELYGEGEVLWLQGTSEGSYGRSAANLWNVLAGIVSGRPQCGLLGLMGIACQQQLDMLAFG